MSNYFLFKTSESTLAPQEDQGMIVINVQTAPNSSLSFAQSYVNQVYDIIKSYSDVENVLEIGQDNGALLLLVLKPWEQRQYTSNQLQPLIQEEMNHITGAQVGVFQPPSLPGGGGGAPIQFIITTSDNFAKLWVVVNDFLNKMRSLGMFTYMQSDLQIENFKRV